MPLAWYLNGAAYIGKNYWTTGSEPGGPPASTQRTAGVAVDYDVLEARHVTGHSVWLRFRDGTAGEVDLTSALRGPVFESLPEVEYFRNFQIHPEFHTLVWPNGADIAPEYLHKQVRVAA